MPPEASCGELVLPRHPSASRRARAFLEERFSYCLTPTATHDLRLVATELVSNALMHGEGQITLRARVDAGAVRVEVVDEGSQRADGIRAQAPPCTSRGGRGLQIVEALSRRWGAHEGTTHVWAEIAAA